MKNPFLESGELVGTREDIGREFVPQAACGVEEGDGISLNSRIANGDSVSVGRGRDHG